MRNSRGSRRVTTPSPPQVVHAFCTLPVPLQRGHWMLNFIRPPICVTWPVPPHSGQSTLPPVVDLPLHPGHVSCRSISSRATPPRTADQKSTLTWYSRSVPGRGPREAALCPPEKIPPKMSRKLPPNLPPACSCAPPRARSPPWKPEKSNPSKSNGTSCAPRPPRPAPPPENPPP